MLPTRLSGLRRSSVGISLVVMPLVLLAHFALRGSEWKREWLWGIYELNFVTILIGPIAAGISAYDGYRLSAERELLATAANPIRRFARELRGHALAVVIVFSVGMVWVFLGVRPNVSGTFPRATDLFTVLPAALLVVFESAIGLLIGWFVSSWLVAPAVAVAVFSASLWLYVNGPEQFIIVGGATDSLANLQPNVERAFGQVAWFAIATLAIVVILRASLISQRKTRVTYGALACLTIVVGGVLLSNLKGPRFVHVQTAEYCSESIPAVCVGLGYKNEVPGVRQRLEPTVRRFHDAELPIPSIFRLNAPRGLVTVAPLSLSMITDGSRESAAVEQAFLLAHLPTTCSLYSSPKVSAAFDGLSWWLRPQELSPMGFAQLPKVLTQGTKQEQSRWLREAMTSLEQCK